MMELSDEDRKLIDRLAPILEDSLRYKIVRSLIDALEETSYPPCLLYTSDAADDLLCVDLGGRRIIKNKHHEPQ